MYFLNFKISLYLLFSTTCIVSEELYGTLQDGSVKRFYKNGTVVSISKPIPSQFVGGAVGIFDTYWYYNAFTLSNPNMNFTLFGATLPLFNKTFAISLPFNRSTSTTSVVSIASTTSSEKVILAGPKGNTTEIGILDIQTRIYKTITTSPSTLIAGAIGTISSTPNNMMILPMVEITSNDPVLFVLLDIPTNKSSIWKLCFQSLSLSFNTISNKMIGIGTLPNNNTLVIVEYSLPNGECMLLGQISQEYTLIYQQTSTFDSTTSTLWTILGKDETSPCELVQFSLSPVITIISHHTLDAPQSTCFSLLNIYYP
jgi:hypothetical protein